LQRAQLRQAAYSEILRRIREEEPPKPSTRLSTTEELPSIAAHRRTEPARLSKLMRGELDWIVMKSLEKDRTRRYETANGFARDIQRYLDGDAVEAGPPSASYKLKKFARKHRAALGTIGAFVLLLVVATAISVALALWANGERRRSEDREQLAIDAVKRFRDAVTGEPELKNNPGLEGLRKRLLKEPLAFFRSLRERLQADNDTRIESLARLAEASFALGGLSHEIGDKQDALIALAESLAIRERLAEANPSVIAFQRDLARSHNNIGVLLEETGKPADALKSHRAALAIRTKLADANPSVSGFQRDLAGSHGNIGNLLSATGKPADALKSYEAALAIQRKLADANPSVSEFQRDLAGSHNNLGMLLRDTAKPADALKSHETALAIRAKLADANPSVSAFQSDRAISHNNIGNLLRATGKPADALKSYRAALAIATTLAGANPSVSEFQRELAESHNNIGFLLTETGKPADALKAFQAALAIRTKLADANPSVSAFQSELANAHSNLGVLLKDTGKPAESLKSHEAALAIQQKLVREHPESPDFASQLGGTLNNLARVDLDAKRFVAARDGLRQAVEWQRRALASNPAHPMYRRFMANHLTNLINVSRAVGDLKCLAEAERQGIELRETDPAMAAFDARLKAIVKGEQRPKDVAELLQLAQRAYELTRHAAAARFWQDALELDPRLVDDRQAWHRYNAARAAALAGCGQGKDDPPPSDDQKTKLRRLAFDWLTAELGAWTKLLATAKKEQRGGIKETLQHWQQDTDLAGIRDDTELAKLPEAERVAFRKLWADVDVLLKKAAQP
jgi:tetratricopeptide (TPR) repeat protein